MIELLKQRTQVILARMDEFMSKLERNYLDISDRTFTINNASEKEYDFMGTISTYLFMDVNITHCVELYQIVGDPLFLAVAREIGPEAVEKTVRYAARLVELHNGIHAMINECMKTTLKRLGQQDQQLKDSLKEVMEKFQTKSIDSRRTPPGT